MTTINAQINPSATINAQINPSARIVAKSVTLNDITPESVGLGNVDNTSDINKPISIAAQAALDLKADQATTYTKAEVDNNIANLVDTAPATLDTLNELAAALGDDASFSTTVTNSIAAKASQTDLDTHISDTNNPHIVTADQIGLGNVDNTSDADKPISTATRDALDDLSGDIQSNRNQITYLNDRVDELYPVYPYTTSIAGGVGSIKNLRNSDLDSGYRLNTAITSITLGSNCKSLGAQTFQGCSSLVEFYYHNSTAGTIGDMCFENCTKYGQGVNAGGNGFTLGKNITAIGNSSYRGCTSLKTVDLLGYDLAAVGRFAFEGCTALEEFTFPAQLSDSQNIFTVISESVLRNCTALTEIEIPSTVTEIQAAAFRGCTALAIIRCYATEAPTLVGVNQFLDVYATSIDVPVDSTGYDTTYAGLTVNYVL